MNDFDKNILQIFTDNPGKDKSIDMNFDGIESSKDLFECMLMFLTNGLKYKYGNQKGIVDLNNLTKKEWIIIQQHFRSFGMQLFYDKVYISNTVEFSKHMINYNNYQNNIDFDKYIFTLYAQPYIYKFSFAFL